MESALTYAGQHLVVSVDFGARLGVGPSELDRLSRGERGLRRMTSRADHRSPRPEDRSRPSSVSWATIIGH